MSPRQTSRTYLPRICTTLAAPILAVDHIVRRIKSVKDQQVTKMYLHRDTLPQFYPGNCSSLPNPSNLRGCSRVPAHIFTSSADNSLRNSLRIRRRCRSSAHETQPRLRLGGNEHIERSGLFFPSIIHERSSRSAPRKRLTLFRIKERMALDVAFGTYERFTVGRENALL